MQLTFTVSDSKAAKILAILADNQEMDTNSDDDEEYYDFADPKCYKGLSTSVVKYLQALATGPKTIQELTAMFGVHYYTNNSAITRRVRSFQKNKDIYAVAWDDDLNVYSLTPEACANIRSFFQV